jgi:MFS family permease
VWIAGFSVGGAIGPLLGGLLERYWWGSVFLLAGPVMMMLLVLGPVLLGTGAAAGVARSPGGPAACWRRNTGPVPLARRGAGSSRWWRSVVRIAVAETRIPSRAVPL